MGEAEREKIETEVLGEICGVDCQMEYGEGKSGLVDGWIMPVVELKRVQQQRDAIITQPFEFYRRETGETTELIHPIHLRCVV